jgi:hypothetical protein
VHLVSDDEKRRRARASYKAWYERNLDHARATGRERTRQWRNANKEKVAAARARDRLKHEYGMGLDDLAALYAAQDGRCSICQQERAMRGPGGLVVDHCHESGKVRGLLCGTCNTGLGHLRDDPGVIAAALAYLEKHRGK